MRRLAGEHLVQHAGETVDVAAFVEHRLGQCLLGTHVFGRAHQQSDLREPAAGRAACQRDAEVRDHRFPLVQQDVLGLDVAMNDALGVGEAERGGDLPRDVERVVDREPPLARESLPKRFAVDERHDVIQEVAGRAGVVQRKDVRVIQACRGIDLAKKTIGSYARRPLRPQDLDRDVAMVLHVVGEIDRRHAAGADLAFNFVAAREGRVQLRDRVHHRGVVGHAVIAVRVVWRDAALVSPVIGNILPAHSVPVRWLR